MGRNLGNATFQWPGHLPGLLFPVPKLTRRGETHPPKRHQTEGQRQVFAWFRRTRNLCGALRFADWIWRGSLNALSSYGDAVQERKLTNVAGKVCKPSLRNRDCRFQHSL
jgi:hypothetical protein